MPSPEVLDRFIATVEANAHVEAIEAFYAPDASMQENELPPRSSRDVLVAHESTSSRACAPLRAPSLARGGRAGEGGGGRGRGRIAVVLSTRLRVAID